MKHEDVMLAVAITCFIIISYGFLLYWFLPYNPTQQELRWMKLAEQEHHCWNRSCTNEGMMYYEIRDPKTGEYAVVNGENAGDAVYNYDTLISDPELREKIIEEDYDSSTNDYIAWLLAFYEVTEIDRANLLETVERRLDGDKRILIHLGR